MESFAVDTPEPHAVVVGDKHIPGHRQVVPRQPVDLLVGRHGEPLLGSRLPAPDDHRIAPVGSILDPSQRPGDRRGIERPPVSRDRPGAAIGEIHAAELRIDPLLEEGRTPVLGPPHPPVGQRRPCRDEPRAGHRPLAACPPVDHHEARRTVEIALHGQHGRIAQRQGPLIGGMVALGQRRERRGAVLGLRKRIPEALQFVEGLTEELRHIRVVIFLQPGPGRGDQVGVARSVPSHPVPDVLTVALPGIRADLVTQFVVVGDVVAVGAAEPLVDIAPVARSPAVAPHAPHRAVGHREGGLEPPAERRHHRLGHHGVALHGPDRHAEQADGRSLLPEHVAQGADHTAVEVVVLHGMAVLVGHKLLVPRHRVAVNGRRSEELHTLREIHHQSVRLEILRVQDEGDAHRAVAEAVVDRRTHRTHVEERPGGQGRSRVGIDHPYVGGADRRPLHRGVGTPRVILRGGALHARQQTRQQAESGKDLFRMAHHVRSPPFCSRSRPW